jgi:hypothetical protein
MTVRETACPFGMYTERIFRLDSALVVPSRTVILDLGTECFLTCCGVTVEHEAKRKKKKREREESLLD